MISDKKRKKDYRKLIFFFLKNMKSKARIKEIYEKTKDLWIEEIRENIKEPLNDDETVSSRDSPESLE
ncbi:MAG: hypothetical protein IJR29_11650 [Butyrivibrio sp.]|nr:hypothetical protein [Butyrivibrio sp.]